MLLREVYRHLRRRAREHGLPDVRGGAVAIVPRVGVALNLNVHLHALVLDGVFARGDNGRLRCHAAPRRPFRRPERFGRVRRGVSAAGGADVRGSRRVRARHVPRAPTAFLERLAVLVPRVKPIRPAA